VILLLLAIVRSLVEFLYVVGLNGNRLCAKSWMASLERRSLRLTRGNDPEDRNVLSLSLSLSRSRREIVCERIGAFSVVIPKKHRSFRFRRAFSTAQCRIETTRSLRIQPGRWKVLLQKSRRKADRKSRTPRVLYFLQLLREPISAR